MKDEVKGLIAFRGGVLDDRNFILATWLKGLYHGNSWFKQIDPTIFMNKYQKVVFQILNDPHTEVRLAVLKDEPSVILGYSVLGPRTIHWVFVKKSWRKVGIARALCPEEVDTCTHLTDVGRSLKPKNMKFDPFI